MLVAPGRGYNSYFEMPFRKHCRITVENRSREPKTLFYMITGWQGDLPDHISYFHAVYRQEHPVQKGRSYLVADGISGKGRFMGITLAVGQNGHNTCWVEGEAKLYIDGETTRHTAACTPGFTQSQEIPGKCTTRRNDSCSIDGTSQTPSTLIKALK